MSYRDTTTKELRQKFGLQYKTETIFSNIQNKQASDILLTILARAEENIATTEKAKSELIVSPILIELRLLNNRVFNVYSGEYLHGDKEKGLWGECDFILCKNNNVMEIEAPVFTLVEAKNGELAQGVAQCMAQMLGAQYFNAKENTPIPTIYGCVTNASDWRFMKLEGTIMTLDTNLYHTNKLEELLGVFQQIIDYYKQYI